jgi:hypothetical protein
MLWRVSMCAISLDSFVARAFVCVLLDECFCVARRKTLMLRKACVDCASSRCSGWLCCIERGHTSWVFEPHCSRRMAFSQWITLALVDHAKVPRHLQLVNVHCPLNVYTCVGPNFYITSGYQTGLCYPLWYSLLTKQSSSLALRIEIDNEKILLGLHFFCFSTH